MNDKTKKGKKMYAGFIMKNDLISWVILIENFLCNKQSFLIASQMQFRLFF